MWSSPNNRQWTYIYLPHSPVYELSNYFVLSRLLHYVPYLSPIHPGRVILTFAGLSAAIEAITANGAAKSANTSAPQSQLDAGKALLKAALILQLAILTLYLIIAGRFQYNCIKSGVFDRAKGGQKQRVFAVLTTLYCSCALISIRTIYRTAEYFEQASIHIPPPGTPFDPTSLSVVIRYEWFFWVFEAMLMVCNSMLFNFRHPARYLPKSLMTYLGTDGVEREGVEFKDPRHWLSKMFDPFDIVGLIRGTDEKWWENGNHVRTGDVESEAAAPPPPHEEPKFCGKLMEKSTGQEN